MNFKVQYTFHRSYFFLFILLFIIEVLIALFAHDQFIRPYFGDFLVVILLYCLLRSFIKVPIGLAAGYVLLFSYLVEILQYFNLVEHLGLAHIKIARILIGTSFAWTDLLAYTLGIICVIVIEVGRIMRTAQMSELKTKEDNE